MQPGWLRYANGVRTDIRSAGILPAFSIEAGGLPPPFHWHFLGFCPHRSCGGQDAWSGACGRVATRNLRGRGHERDFALQSERPRASERAVHIRRCV